MKAKNGESQGIVQKSSDKILGLQVGIKIRVCILSTLYAGQRTLRIKRRIVYSYSPHYDKDTQLQYKKRWIFILKKNRTGKWEPGETKDRE